MLIGAPDTGKTTLAMDAIRIALAEGRTPVLVDADVGNPTIGPPGCVGMKVFDSEKDISAIEEPDGLQFVGAVSPARLVLQHVVATSLIVEQARQRGDVIIIDTTGVASGAVGETLKYHKTELCRPDKVVALQRGEEMEPVVGMLQRFLDTEVLTAPSSPNLNPATPDDRDRQRRDRFGKAMAEPSGRWKVRSTVFAPTLPMGMDLERLDGLVVGVQDAGGDCLGLGVLSYEKHALRVTTSVGVGMTGLRLGSMRLDLGTMKSSAVNLRELMFGI